MMEPNKESVGTDVDLNSQEFGHNDLLYRFEQFSNVFSGWYTQIFLFFAASRSGQLLLSLE